MSGSNRQILELAKQGLTAPEIASSLGYDVEAVEFVLTNDAQVANELERCVVSKLENSFAQLEDMAVKTVKEIMQFGDKDSTRLSAATLVIDQRLGLKKPKQSVVVFNIGSINETIRQVKERRRQLEQGSIEVDSKLVAA